MAILPMNEEILPPHDDYVFKALLTHPDAKPALIDLIASVIGRNVTDVSILNNELPLMDSEEKAERLDVNCIIDGTDQINVEMQGSRLEEYTEGHTNFINKYVYYMTDLHSSQKSKGVKYSDFARTYQITFVTYEVFENRPDFITRASLRSDDGAQITNQLNSIFIELSKLGGVLSKAAEEMSPLEMWSAFLGYASDPKKRSLINDIIDRREPINMASNVLTTISKDDHERAKFRSRRKAETDRMSNLLTAEARGKASGFVEGEASGIVKGEAIGIAKGEAIGITKGEAIGIEKEKKNIAVKLLKLKLSLHEISTATGLNVDALEKLKNEIELP